MKNNLAKGFTIAIAATVGLTSCNGLIKMAKKYNTVTYTVTPNPLEMHGDSVKVAISGKYPAKFFWKKATVTVQPVLKTSSGEVTLKSKTFVGEKVKNAPKDAQVIKTAEGGSFSYNDVVAYKPEMMNSTLEFKAGGAYKSKSKEFPAIKAGDATIVTPLLVQNEEKTIMAKDAMPKMVPMSYNADVHYLINQSDLRSSESSQEDIKGLAKFIDDANMEVMEGKKVVGSKAMYAIKGIQINSAASPDGELDRNSNLSNERGETAKKYILDQMKKLKMDAPAEGFFSMTSIGEDWNGFKSLMEASTVPDKEMILRILSTYSDNDVREKEMKNIAKAYTEISDQIFPKLRKATIAVNAEKACKTDEELKNFATSKPDTLNVEELMYAATLFTDLNQKLSVYQSVARLFPADWRGHNNAGCILVMQNKMGDAKSAFEAANKAQANATIKNNLGVIASLSGDRKAAEAMFKEAAGAGPEVGSNAGKINIQNGDYSAAVSNFGNTQSFNAALAKLLSGDKEGALKTIEASQDANSANGHYLKAVIGARMGNQAVVAENLAKAVQKDPALKDRAKNDKEFIKFKLD